MACTAIVVGNMVGSGFYLSPAAVAPYGALSIVAWAVMGAGAGCLGLVFARLARMAPATGGPYAYTRMAFGDFAGFLVAWGYWISIWASLPAIAVAVTGSATQMIPSLRGNRVAMVAITLGVMWSAVAINLRGVKSAGLVASIATYSKLVPFGAIALFGLFYVNLDHFTPLNPSGQSLFTAGAALAPLTMFAFLGMESATVAAGDVINPERTIARATVLGVAISTLLYILGTVVVLGVMTRAELADSTAPFADTALALWGPMAALMVSLAVMISSVGALNGWTLLMGQVPMAAADDGLFPAMFARRSARGVPATGIVVSASMATALVLVQLAGGGGFAAIYALIVSLSTLTAVIPYAFCALAAPLIVSGGKRPKVTVVDAVAFTFSMFVIYGCGPEAVLYGLLLLLLGIPVFVWQRRQHLALPASALP
jgi:APA family basic amino acid/polyamine antiporter